MKHHYFVKLVLPLFIALMASSCKTTDRLPEGALVPYGYEMPVIAMTDIEIRGDYHAHCWATIPEDLYYKEKLVIPKDSQVILRVSQKDGRPVLVSDQVILPSGKSHRQFALFDNVEGKSMLKRGQSFELTVAHYARFSK